MPLVPDSELKETYRRMITGEVAVVGWGALREILGYYDWLCPWPFETIIDNDRLRWGQETIGTRISSPDALKRFSPDHSVVVVLPPHNSQSFSDIIEQIDKLGPYRCVPSRSLVRIAALDGPTAPKATQDDVWELVEILSGWGARSQPKNEALRALYRIARCAGIRAASLAHLHESLRSRAAGAPANGSRRVALCVGRLGPGGAERQMTLLARRLKAMDYAPHVILLEAPDDRGGSLEAFLRDHGVPIHVAPKPPNHSARESTSWAISDVPRDLLPYLWSDGSLREAADRAIAVAGYAKMFRVLDLPNVVAYLDPHNVSAALAALSAEGTRIVASGRNLHPGHFPHFYGHDWEVWREIYRILVEQPRYTLSCNSRRGSLSYAEWLGISVDRVPTIPNAISDETFAGRSASEISTIRREVLDVGPEDFCVLGVFRLSEEKRPEDYVRVLESVTSSHPRIQGRVYGEGALEDRIQNLIDELGLTARVRLMGTHGDIPGIMAASDLLLHTAEAEGMPNVIGEALAQELPIVCTDVGDVREMLPEQMHRQLCSVGDVAGMVERVQGVAEQPDSFRRLCELGKEHAQRYGSEARLAETTVRALRGELGARPDH